MTTAKRRAPRAPAIPFPELPDVDAGALFWRAAWLRSQAKLAALKAHAERVWSQRGTTAPLRHALLDGERAIEEAIKEEFEHLIRAGGLLYAWLPEGGAA